MRVALLGMGCSVCGGCGSHVCSAAASWQPLMSWSGCSEGESAFSPEPTVEEIIKRLRHRYEGSADENSPSLASWASPST